MPDTHAITQPPDLSVIMPVCNKEKQLERAVRSILDQTLQNLEIIVADDGSTDRTAEILRGLAASDPRIRTVTHSENRGTLQTRLDAFHASSGRYLLCLDADDTLDADGAAALLTLAEREQADLVGFGARLLAGGKTVGTVDAVKHTLTGRNIFEAVFCRHLYNWSVCLKLIRRDLFEKAAGQLEVFYCVSAEDFYFYTVLSHYAERLVMSGKIFYNYNIADGLTGETDAGSFRRYATMLDALQAIRRFLEKNDLSEEYADAFSAREREHFRMLLKRYPGTADALAALLEKYDAGKVRKYLAEFFNSEYAGAALTALEQKKPLPERPPDPADAPGTMEKLSRMLVPESPLWFLAKRCTDWFRWRRYS